MSSRSIMSTLVNGQTADEQGYSEYRRMKARLGGKSDGKQGGIETRIVGEATVERG